MKVKELIAELQKYDRNNLQKETYNANKEKLDIIFETKPNYGIKVLGSEKIIRLFDCDGNEH